MWYNKEETLPFLHLLSLFSFISPVNLFARIVISSWFYALPGRKLMPRSRGVRNHERETGNKTGKHPESEKEMFQNEIPSGCRSNLILKIQKKNSKISIFIRAYFSSGIKQRHYSELIKTEKRTWKRKKKHGISAWVLRTLNKRNTSRVYKSYIRRNKYYNRTT